MPIGSRVENFAHCCSGKGRGGAVESSSSITTRALSFGRGVGNGHKGATVVEMFTEYEWLFDGGPLAVLVVRIIWRVYWTSRQRWRVMFNMLSVCVYAAHIRTY